MWVKQDKNRMEIKINKSEIPAGSLIADCLPADDMDGYVYGVKNICY
jgi:hypothetical protein